MRAETLKGHLDFVLLAIVADEPAHGYRIIEELKRRFGLTVLMAEQNLAQAIRIADRGYVIVHGRIEFEGRSRAELAAALSGQRSP